ncbi:alpha-glucuronidase family glycosyl hydrolase [Arcticibacter sp. MXS-1]|uniref:alpha-glucuronidase family glycosyl hydrolase n=1 Tax=Arcticibacter sp. MXS-1 TaxID=3341726 RepID=UPI0035A837AD
MKRFHLLVLMLILGLGARAKDGYDLWLNYRPVKGAELSLHYKNNLTELIFPDKGELVSSAREELRTALKSMLGVAIPEQTKVSRSGALMVGVHSADIARFIPATDLKSCGDEGFLIRSVTSGGKKLTVLTANTGRGILYGVFALIQRIQLGERIDQLSISDRPKVKVRVLNHWDNLDRTVERGYAGFSLWDWQRLPGYVDPRYIDYARANASIGINGTVLTNVNANALILTPSYLEKVAALAKVFRRYGIKVYLTARFSAPIEIGGLKTADPMDKEVRQWWKEKADEIYRYVPDFGGFLVKANSEGQPGPQNYGRNHADGANMLAEALEPRGGIVMWRAFVYDNKVPTDRAKQAYTEFKPLDGQFRKNVLIQVKNGPIDFQPREPFHPLFGAMPQTPMMMEFQITQEYLGFATHLVYLGALFKETLAADTYAKGKGSTVAKVIDGSLDNHQLSGMAGVANIGNDLNWTGHPFGQANWYAFGRLAWNPYGSAEQIAEDWLKLTFAADKDFNKKMTDMMMLSREAVVNYMTPLGLHHIMGWDHHYGPGPWISNKPRADWTSVYYHKADSAGIGFNRTATGSNALEQYAPEIRKQYGDIGSIPEKYLLWFHHVNWDQRLQSGRSLWEELCFRYNLGVDQVKEIQQSWNLQKAKVDPRTFSEVSSLLAIQLKEAKWWRDACLLYFQTFSRRPIPQQYEKPAHDLEFYEKQQFHFVPGI